MSRYFTVTVFSIMCLITNTTTAFAGCYLLKVNIWPEKVMSKEMLDDLKKESHGKFTTKYGKTLRLSADNKRQDLSCEDIRSGKADDTTGVNTGKIRRSTQEHLITITYGSPFNKKTIEGKTDPDGIARFYFEETSRLEIIIKDKSAVIPPYGTTIFFEATEWMYDSGKVMSVHFYVKE